MISLETPLRNWASSLLEGRTSWIFSSCGRCSRLTTGTTGTRSGGLRKGQSPCELLGGLSGFLSRRCCGLRPGMESVREPEDNLSSADMDLGVLLESPQGSQSSTRVGASTCAFTRAVAAVSRFPSRGSRDPWLSIEAFPRGFPTSLNHRAVPRVIVLWVDPRLEI